MRLFSSGNFISHCHVDRVHRSSVTAPGNSPVLKTLLSWPTLSPTFGKRLCDRSSTIKSDLSDFELLWTRSTRTVRDIRQVWFSSGPWPSTSAMFSRTSVAPLRTSCDNNELSSSKTLLVMSWHKCPGILSMLSVSSLYLTHAPYALLSGVEMSTRLYNELNSTHHKYSCTQLKYLSTPL